LDFGIWASFPAAGKRNKRGRRCPIVLGQLKEETGALTRRGSCRYRGEEGSAYTTGPGGEGCELQ